MQTLDAVKILLMNGHAGTQEEISEKLKGRGLNVTQSTISRTLRKLGAVRMTNTQGQAVYRLPESLAPNIMPKIESDTSLKGHLHNITTNGSLIVLHTTPGSSSLIARVLDSKRPGGILGTLAGDDTIFVAPASAESIPEAISSIRNLFSNH